MWEKASEADVAFVAGLFEGEGCITASKQASGYYLAGVRISSTDKDVLEKIISIVHDGKLYKGTDKRPKNKQLWLWHINRQELIWQFMDRIEPWLGCRRKERYAEVKRLATKVGRKKRCSVCQRVFEGRNARCSDKCEREFKRVYHREYNRSYRKAVKGGA